MTDTPDLAIDPAAEHDAEAAGCETHSHHGYMKEKDRYKARLKRIEGQVRGIHRMIDEEQYCIDILTQVSAINSALRNVALGLLDDLNESDEAAEIKFKEVADAIARFAR
jgi:DNA-binding FrmR family transcriptional regulator